MKSGTKNLVGLALLTAVVVVLQSLGSFIRFGIFSVSLVLIPIVIGAALYGVKAASFLGLAFGITVLVSGDANFFLTFNAFGTIITVLAKGILCGFLTALVYKLTKNVLISAIVCPIVNTGVFVIGCLLFFMPLAQDAYVDLYGAVATGKSDLVVALVAFVGLNFFAELIFNIVISPVVVRLINLRKSK